MFSKKTEFQSLKGKIQTRYGFRDEKGFWYCFNPSKVRYKLFLFQDISPFYFGFQSLKGKIQTTFAAKAAEMETEFQSLKGKIQTNDYVLKLVLKDLFQSLKGKIQTPVRASISSP